ncbi:signal peptidase II [Methylobacterium iners]|uniref:Lipoprotein signal peptidase n=1 Tax=Methylobacterium iners TaxID=418707 RepID=A0ABQ4RUP1_9HYPH|nr:signal peptidase II [Methylobacterium iners]GJD94486.1 Lipoprotein signal peptidase [Methylobacterium iners]
MRTLSPPLTVAGVAACAAALDLWTKSMAVDRLGEGEVRGAIPFIDLSLQFNRGISFSLFQAGSPASVAALLTVQAALTTFILVLALRATVPLQRLGLALIAGGALGNLVDRFVDGAVTDFLGLHTAGIHWFAFNLADFWISLGVVLLVLDGITALRQDDGTSRDAQR